MSSKRDKIPVYNLPVHTGEGIFVNDLGIAFNAHQSVLDQPHRSSYYVLLIIISGELRGQIDFEPVFFTGPAVILIAPDQVHRLDHVAHPRGYSLLFDKAFMPDHFHKVLSGYVCSTKFPDKQNVLFDELIILAKIALRVKGKSKHYGAYTAGFLLEAMLGLMSTEIEDTRALHPKKDNRAKEIEKDFRHLLNTHFKQWKMPSAYAKAMHFSVAHLNDTLKKITGNSLTWHIQERTMLEAKRLLYHTDLSAKEIGFLVGYDDAVYFSRIFKKHTGFTPLKFRHEHTY